jgi:hypothetical protein
MDSLEKIFADYDSDAEGANYHDFVGRAESIFEAIKKYIPQKDHKRVASAICENLSNIF